MRIERLVQWTRDLDHDFLRELEIFNGSFTGPNLLVCWDPRPIYDSLTPKRAIDQDARWEFFFELKPSTHRDATNLTHRSDTLRNGRWYRKFISWSLRDNMFNDIGYAPLEWDPFTPLRMADTWRNRRFFEDTVEDPGLRAEAEQLAGRTQIIKDVGRYYQDLDRTLVSPGGRHTGGWRHKIR